MLEKLGLTRISMEASLTETSMDRSHISNVSRSSLPLKEKTANPDDILDSTDKAIVIEEHVTIHAANAKEVLPNNISLADEPENTVDDLNHTEYFSGIGSSTPSGNAKPFQMLEELGLARISMGAPLTPETTPDRSNMSDMAVPNLPVKEKTANPD